MNVIENCREFIALPSHPDRNKSDWKIISSKRDEGRPRAGNYPETFVDKDKRTVGKFLTQNRMNVNGGQRKLIGIMDNVNGNRYEWSVKDQNFWLQLNDESLN